MASPTAAAGWLIGLVLTAAACEEVTTVLEDKAQEVAREITPPEAGEVPEASTLSKHQQLARKLSLYTECLDRASQRIHDSFSRYDERVKPDGTPRKKGTQPYLYKIDSELIPCAEAARRGPHDQPPLPAIELAMVEYLHHAQAFADLSVQLDTYYEQEGYKEDDWARSKDLAPGFASASEAWSQADARLQQRVRTRKEEVDRALLAEVQARRGQDLEWHARNLVLAAKALTRCVSAPDATATGCRPAHDQLRAAQAGFTAACEQDAAGADAVFWMTAFRGSSERYLAQADQAVPALGKGKGKGKGKADPASTDPLDRAFGALVSDFDNLRFER